MTEIGTGQSEGEGGKGRKQMRGGRLEKEGGGGIGCLGTSSILCFLGSLSYGFGLLAEKINCKLFVPVIPGVGPFKEKKVSVSTIQSFIQQPASTLCMPLLGGGQHKEKECGCCLIAAW